MPGTKAVRTRFEHANPILNVTNLARSVRYYVDILGFINAEWGGDDFTCVIRDGASIYLSGGDQGQPGTWVDKRLAYPSSAAGAGPGTRLFSAAIS